MQFGGLLRLVLAGALVLSGISGCGGGGSAAPTCTGVCGEPYVDEPGSEATGFPQLDGLQRESFQVALVAASMSPFIGMYAASTPITAPMATSACANNETTAVATGTVAATLNVTVSHYYDSACTKLWWTGAFVATNNSVTTTMNGTYTYYTSAGSVYAAVGPATLTITTTGPMSSFSLSASVASSATSAAIEQFGVGCNTTAGTHACSFAVDQTTSLPNNGEYAQIFGGNVGVSTAGNSTTVSYGSNSQLVDAAGAELMPSASSSNIWGFGGAPISDHSVTLGGSLSYTGSGITAMNLAVADFLTSATVVLSFNPVTQLVTGTVAPTAGGATIATVSLSQLGQGTITYHDGTTAPIANWVIQG